MYSYHVSDLIFEDNNSTENSSEEDSSSEVENVDIRQLILKDLEKKPRTPETQYLIQCADWQQSQWDEDKWIAYSPVSDRSGYGYWPIYDLELRFASGNITFKSWKGDYEPQVYQLPVGNLNYTGGYLEISGDIWTRGE